MGGELMQCFGLELGNTHQCLKYAYPKYSLWNLSYRDICAAEQECGQGWAFQVMLVVKNLPANAGDRGMGSVPGLTGFHGEGHGDPLQYSCLENPVDRGDWWPTVSGCKESDTLKPLSTHAYTRMLTDGLSGLWWQKKWVSQIVHHQMVPVYEKYHVAAKRNEVKLCMMIQKGVYHILSWKKKSKF